MSRCRFSSFLAIPAMALVAFVLPPASVAATEPEMKMALRDLWVEHVFWIRSYVVATHAHDPVQAKIAEQEVVSNAKALAGTITPFYGQAASDQLFKLLAGHWGAVREYNSAALAGSRPAQDKATTKLINNAREIAMFLGGANPNLPEDAVFGLLSSHGGHHIEQINELGVRDFAGEAKTWHVMRRHMLVISDAIADAIVKQFPERFQGRS